MTPNSLITPQKPYVGIATLTAPAAITSRANIVGTTGLVKLTDTSTNGRKVNRIHIKGKGASVAAKLFVWFFNGTTSHLFDEIDIPVANPTNTLESVLAKRDYSGEGLDLEPLQQLYVSVTVSQDLNVFAPCGDY